MATPTVKEEVVVSERFQLTKQDVAKWISNQISYLKPLGVFVGLLYVGFVIPRVQDNGIQLSDFVPNNAVITSVALYILNGLYDLFSKWSDTKKYIVPKQ